LFPCFLPSTPVLPFRQGRAADRNGGKEDRRTGVRKAEETRGKGRFLFFRVGRHDHRCGGGGGGVGERMWVTGLLALADDLHKNVLAYLKPNWV
jgi:hypothetical protein